MSNAAPTLSIITVALDEAAHLPRLKQSLDRLTLPPGVAFETILVDGGSLDGTAAAARDLGFRHIVECAGVNIPMCRNIGAQHAGGPWLAYVDADCELPTDWLQRAWDWMTRGDTHLMGWPVRPPADCPWLPAAWHLHWSTKNRRWTDVDGARVVKHQAYRLITTRCLLVKRSAFDALGGFDEQLDTGEDADFVRRADAAGFPVLAIPQLEAVHYGEPKTVGAFFRQQLWHANRSSHTAALRKGHARGVLRAPFFALLFLAFTVLGCVSILRAAITLNAQWLGGLIPLCALVLGPALLTAIRARRIHFAGALALLYFVYGMARCIDLLGLSRDKRSWKRAHRAPPSRPM